MQPSSTIPMFGTSWPADAPVKVTVKPVAAAPVTVAVPAKPAIALIAAVDSRSCTRARCLRRRPSCCPRCARGTARSTRPSASRVRKRARDRVLERPRRRDGGDRERAVVAADADSGDRDDVAHRPVVSGSRLDRRRRSGRVRARHGGSHGSTAGDLKPCDAVRVLDGPRARDCRDREGSVVASDPDAGDRDDVANLDGMRRAGRDRDRRAGLLGAAAGCRARRCVDADVQRSDRRNRPVALPERDDLHLVAAAEVAQRDVLHLVDRRPGSR